jgi:hypothetical protein
MQLGRPRAFVEAGARPVRGSSTLGSIHDLSVTRGVGADVRAILAGRRVVVIGDATGNVEFPVLRKNLVAVGEVFAVHASLVRSKPTVLEEA